MNDFTRRSFLQGLGVTVAGSVVAIGMPHNAFSHDTVFILDVSGGMPLDKINKIMLEASKHNGLLITFSIDVLDVIDLADLTPDTKLSMGGGTCIKGVEQYLKEHNISARNTVVFTDGYIFDEWGNDWSPNTTFVIVNNNSYVDSFSNTTIVIRKRLPSVGKIVYI